MINARPSCLEFGRYLVEICNGNLLRILLREKLFKLVPNPLFILERSSGVPPVQTVELSKDGQLFGGTN